MMISWNKKKKVLNIFEWLFFVFYIIMPSYFAIEISSSIPLITASRFVLILLFISIIIRKKWKIPIVRFDDRIKFYFIILVFVDCYHIFDSGSYAIKDLFKLLMEQFLVYWSILIVIDSKEKFNAVIKVLFYTSGFVALISIIGYFFDTNYFYLLKTTNRDMLMTGLTSIGYRSGSLRIEAGFSHPVYYGVYLCFMIFLGLYLLLKQIKLRYIIIVGLNAVALFLCNSRGSILALFMAAIYAFLFNGRKLRKQYIKYAVVVMIATCIIIVLIPNIREYLQKLINSIVVYFGGSSSVSLSNFGANMNFLKDRWKQLSGILWTIYHNPIFGLGPLAHTRGLLSYVWDGTWSVTDTIDVAYVGIICEYGFIGMLAYALLFSIPFIGKLKKGEGYDTEAYIFKDIFIVYFICMLSVVTQDKVFWVVFSAFMAYFNISKENEKICRENKFIIDNFKK